MFLVGDHVGFSDNVKLDARLHGQLVFGNLEGSWCRADGKPLPRKAGPRVLNHSVVKGPRWVFALANNHMMDYGVEGLVETRERLSAHGIPFAGAGRSLEEAQRPVLVEECGKRIGILSCAEHQFGMADERTPGIAPLGMWLLGAIRKLRTQVDVVIVSVHAAVEMSPIPAPELRTFYHALIDAGADVIHGHHAHVPQGWEKYKDGYVFYGLGNFLVDPARWPEANTRWSLVAELDLSGDSIKASVSSARILQTGDGASVELVPAAVREDYLVRLNSIFADEALFRGAWQEMAVSLYHSLYEHNLGFYPIDETGIGMRNWIKRLYHTAKTLWAFLRRREKSDYPLVQYNYVQCESHRMLLAEAMGVSCGCREDCRTEKSKSIIVDLLMEASM